MAKSTQESLVFLSSTFSKLMKRRFGKGPETCYITLSGNRIYIYTRNFVTPAEEVLLTRNELNLAHRFRSFVTNSVMIEFIPEVKKVLGSEFEQYFHDWNYDSNRGIIILENGSSLQEVKGDTLFRNILTTAIKDVGAKYHKRPNTIELIKYSQNTCAVECKEILLPLEKLLFAQGNDEMLLHHNLTIKNGYLEHKNLFEDVFNRLIEDIFMMRDYQNDRHYLIFVFNKIYQMN